MSDDPCHFCGGLPDPDNANHTRHTETCAVTDRLREIRAHMDEFEKTHLPKMHEKRRIMEDLDTVAVK